MNRNSIVYSRDVQVIFAFITIMMLLFPYPGFFSPIYSFFIVILFCFAILKLNIVKHKIHDIFLFMVLILSAIPCLLYGHKFFVLQYVLSAVLIYLIIRRNERNVLCKSETIANLILFSNLFFMLFFHESHPIESRYSIINGDPNYTSLFYFVTTFVSCKITTNKYKKILSIFVMSFVVYLTDSRMMELMLFYVLLDNIPFFCRIIRTRFICYCIFFISLSAQVILAYSSELIDVISQIFFYSDSGLRISNVIDSSNIKRIDAARNAVEFLKEPAHFIYGSVMYSKEAGVHTIPHHWFLLPSVTYGVIFTSVYAFFLFSMIKHLDEAQRVGFSLMFISGAILGSVPIVNCLPVIIFYSSVTERQVN